MLPLDFRHVQQTINHVFAATVARMSRGRLILANIVPLQSPGAVHRRQPTRHVTQELQRPTDNRRARLATVEWPGCQAREQVTQQFAVLPLIILDVLNRIPLVRVTDRMPVTAIGIRSRQLTGVGQLKKGDELYSTIDRRDRHERTQGQEFKIISAGDS